MYFTISSWKDCFAHRCASFSSRVTAVCDPSMEFGSWLARDKKAMPRACVRINTDRYGTRVYIDGLSQNCSNSIANALELLQPCAKPSIRFCCFQFDMVCERRPLVATSQSVFMAGLMVGIMVSGILSDRYTTWRVKHNTGKSTGCSTAWPGWQRRLKKNKALDYWSFVEGNPPLTGRFPSQRASDTEVVMTPLWHPDNMRRFVYCCLLLGPQVTSVSFCRLPFEWV